MDEVKKTLELERAKNSQMLLSSEGLIELNLVNTAIMQILVDKGICTEEEIEETIQKVLDSDDYDFKENLENIEIAKRVNEIRLQLDPSEEDIEYIKTEGKKILSDDEINQILKDMETTKKTAKSLDIFKQFTGNLNK